MLAFIDATAAVNEASSERMQFRAKPRIAKAIKQASELSGVDYSAFTMSAAYEAAMRVIAAHERTELQRVDHQAFFDALDNAPEPTAKLRAALEQRKRTTVSR